MTNFLRSEVAMDTPVESLPEHQPQPSGVSAQGYDAQSDPAPTGFSFEPAPKAFDGVTDCMWSPSMNTWVDPDTYGGSDLVPHPGVTDETTKPRKAPEEIQQELEERHEADEGEDELDDHLTEGASLGDEAEDIVDALGDSPIADELDELLDEDRDRIEALDDIQLGLRVGDVDNAIDVIQDQLGVSKEVAQETYEDVRSTAMASLGDHIGEGQAASLFAYASSDKTARQLAIDYALGKLDGPFMEKAYAAWYAQKVGSISNTSSSRKATKKRKYR